ncbi:MAG: hypothetical protein NTX76_01265 [Alphaproteobacteria bacterium]|nr:hypothetical protein [Alphaproteobacteria bacterium]
MKKYLLIGMAALAATDSHASSYDRTMGEMIPDHYGNNFRRILDRSGLLSLIPPPEVFREAYENAVDTDSESVILNYEGLQYRMPCDKELDISDVSIQKVQYVYRNDVSGAKREFAITYLMGGFSNVIKARSPNLALSAGFLATELEFSDNPGDSVSIDAGNYVWDWANLSLDDSSVSNEDDPSILELVRRRGI